MSKVYARNVENNRVKYLSKPLDVPRCILKVTSEEIIIKFRKLERYKLKNIGDKRHQVLNET